MEIKTYVVKNEEVDSFLFDKSHFGWELVNKEAKGKKKTKINIKRVDIKYKHKDLVKLEKQYNFLIKPISTSTIVWFIIGLAFLIPYLIFIKHLWGGAFLGLSIFSLLMSLYCLIVFLASKHNKKAIALELIKEADSISGVDYLYPFPNAIVNSTTETYNLKNYFSRR